MHRNTWKYVLGGMATGFALGYYATRVEPTWLHVKKIKVPLEGLSSAFNGFKIVQLSDFHYKHGENLPPHFLQEVVDRVNFLQPSMLVITGDFVHNLDQVDVDVKFLASYLSQIEAPFGKFAVLGNHDYNFFHNGFREQPDNATDDMIRILREAGIVVLRNQFKKIHRGKEYIQLVGLDDLDAGYFDAYTAMRGVNLNKNVIALSHNPDSISHFWRRYRVDLMLCGHTHGSQVKLPFINVPRAVRLRWFNRGMYVQEGIQMYINKGIGWGMRKVRFNARPEITLLTLKAV